MVDVVKLREDLLAVGLQITDHVVVLDRLYATRLKLYQRARSLDPPMRHAEIATLAQTTEEAVIKALAKARNGR